MGNNQEEHGGISYPCLWAYRVIGRDQEEVRRAVAATLAGRECLVYEANRSRGGKYHSLHIELVVKNQTERDGFFQRLKGHPAVVMVL